MRRLYRPQAMDGAGGRTRLEAYKREDVEALVAEALRKRAELREALDDARHEALARQVPQELEVVPRTDADDALRQLESELAALRAQLAHAQANLAATPVAPAVPVVVPLTNTPAPAPAEPLPVELQPTASVPIVPAAPVAPAAPAPFAPAPIVERVVVERPFSKATGLLQVVTWSVIVAVVLIVLLAWFA